VNVRPELDVIAQRDGRAGNQVSVAVKPGSDNRRMPSLLIASNNAHKHGELREIFGALAPDLRLITPREAGIDLDPDETADTYLGNALLKARAFAAAAGDKGVWVIADDSGLEVDALHGRPGILSARYHKQAPGQDGCAALLVELRGVPAERRTARFQAVIVLISPNGEERAFTGACEGRIGSGRRGAGGFGFDPVFMVGTGPRMMAELPPAEKNRVSHRGLAAAPAAAYLNGAL